MSSLWLILSFLIVSDGSYLKIPKTDLPWLNDTRISNCGVGTNIPCNITYLSSQCDKMQSCSGFNTNGYIKKCDLNRCGCQLSVASCELASNNTDLYLKPGSNPPQSWRASILNSSLFYDGLINKSAPATWYQPEIGNGYIGVVVDIDKLYVTGLYNGKCGDPPHKARMPSTQLVTIKNAHNFINGLDVNHAKFIKRWKLNNYSDDIIIQQTFLAHRKYRNILAMEFQLLNAKNSVDIDVYLNDASKVTNGDFEFEIISYGNYTENKPMIYEGQLTQSSDEGYRFNVTVVKDVIPNKIHFDANNNKYIFISSLMTTMPDDDNINNSAMNEYLNARSLIKNNSLIIQHENEWDILHESGIDIWPFPNNTQNDDAIIGLNGLGMNFNTANSIAGHVNSSLYYLYSSIRSDWNHGASPGGIGTGMYRGAVFFDMDWYITPALLLLQTNMSNSLLKYRYNSINASQLIAKIFGYEGAMYPWPSAYNGHATGCCDGVEGGKEGCFEQHVTGDIGIVTWYYYLITKNNIWLQNIGYPILSNISNWIISRVKPKPNINDNNVKYSVNNILPVDEWCVPSGCGCGNGSVDNDVQMNAVCKLTLKYTVEAAKILNISNTNITLYQKVQENIQLLFNDTYNRHNQFTSPECPNGFNGKHYTSGHGVCPEDVLYLYHPLNANDLNISTSVIKNDYDFFVPRTCQENAGMTTPIHTIVATMLIGKGIGNVESMEGEFNRSNYGACYGPYNVRNEVDNHPNIVGGTKNNTHFLTGDGGFIQQFIFGFGGIKIVQNGLSLQKPYLPQNVYKMRLRKLFWRNFYLTIQIESNENMIIDVIQGNINNIRLFDGNNKQILPTNNAFNIFMNDFKFPGLLTDEQP
eukprot:190880_1